MLPARLVFAFRWVAIVAIVLAVAVILLRRKLPSRPRIASQPAPNPWKELWLRWLDAREDSRERSANLCALRGKRALLAEPDEKSSRVLTWRLNKLRCSVHRTRSGAQALRAAREIKPELVVADAFLPDISAEDFFQSLPRHDVPVIFLGVSRDQWDHIRSLGGNVFCLSKPYDPDDVASLAGLVIRRQA